MKRSIARSVAAGVTLALLIFFMPLIFAGFAAMFLLAVLVSRVFFYRKLRKTFARKPVSIRKRDFTTAWENGQQVIYLNNKY